MVLERGNEKVPPLDDASAKTVVSLGKFVSRHLLESMRRIQV